MRTGEPRCSGCGNPLTPDNSHGDSRSRGGRWRLCKSCRRAEADTREALRGIELLGASSICKGCGKARKLANGLCRPCLREHDLRQCNRCLKVKSRLTDFWQKKATCKSCHPRGEKPTNPGKRDALLLKLYGITEGQYRESSDHQEGKCAICGEKPDIALAVDHCHASKRFRGLLCSKCNLGLGCFRDRIDFLTSAISYLVKSRLTPA